MDYHMVILKFILVCLISTRVYALESDKIIGDDQNVVANPTDYGYHVTVLMINYTTNEKTNKIEREASLCGGSIISERHVITAAHCVKGKLWAPELYVLLAGHELIPHDPSAVSNYIQVTSVYVTYGWAYSHRFDQLRHANKDFAVIELSERLCKEKYPYIKILNLPTEEDKNNVILKGFKSKVVGRGAHTLGKTKEGKLTKAGGEIDLKLRATSITIIPDTIVYKFLPTSRCDKAFTICGTPSELSDKIYYGALSSGDSGGGLVYGDTLMGILMSSSEYEVGKPSMHFFANVWYHKEMILKMMADNVDDTYPNRIDKHEYDTNFV